MKKRVIGILTLIIMMSVIFFFETSGSEVFAANGSVKPKDGFISVEYLDLAEFRDGDKKIAPEAPKDYANYIFAGWYKDEDCKQAYSNVAADTTLAYAKFVPESILSVKAQLKADATNTSETTNMRLVSSVDSLRYQNVGFEIYYNGAETPIPINATKVFRRIVASEESGVDYNYSAQVVDKESQYFVTATLLNIKNDNFGKTFYVKPYWTTLDGTTVYGVSKYVTIENGLDKSNVNLTVNVGEGFDANNMQVTIGGKDYTATVAYYDEGKYAHLNVNVPNRDTVLKALNTVSVTDGTITASTEYRNLYAKYSGDKTEDTTWYDEDADVYTIATSAELYGLASLVNDEINFSGKTVYLIADIEVNKGRVTETGWSTFEEDGTTPIEDATSYEWVPIGQATAFAGTFDGQEHIIKGIYVNATEEKAGLFGFTSAATVQNVRLENSYIYSKNQYVGSIIGFVTNTTVSNVYSNAYVAYEGTKSNGTGGIIGYINTVKNANTISGCWFDGSISGYDYCGGIVGKFNNGNTNTISDTLFTGDISSTYTTQTSSTGGIIGGLGNKPALTVTISTSISVGNITGGKNAGSVVGYLPADTGLNINDVYTTDKGVGTIASGREYEDATQIISEASILNGHIAYDTIKQGFSVLKREKNDGAWAIREKADNLKQGVPVPVAFADEWIDVAWYYDTDGKTYSISTAEELYGFSDISQDYNFSGDTIQLANDISVNSGKASSWVAGTATPGRQWKPIGKDTLFAGTFDGQKKTISGIYVNETTQNAGLFAAAKDDVSTIKNVRLTNSYIYSSMSGDAQVGSIIGYARRTKLTNLYSNAYVESPTGNRVGGIVGELYNANKTKDISECWFDGSVQGSTYVGGIVGRDNNGTSKISNVLVTGAVKSTKETDANYYTGGIIGGFRNAAINLTIENSVHTGTVEDSCASGDKRGGIVGYRPEAVTISFDDVYTTFTVGIGTQPNKGTVAIESDIASELDINEVKGELVYTNGVMNLGYYMYDSTWVARKTDIPVPRCFVGTVVDANDIVEDTSAHTAWYDANPDAKEFEIKTENDFLGVAVIVNDSEGTYASEQFKGQTIKLVKDMDLNRGWLAPQTVTEEVKEPAITWTPIGNDPYKFLGTFDGQGHEIKGIYASGTQYVGLFGYGDNATLKNFELKNSYIYGSAKRVGSVIGCNSGNMTEIYSDALVVSASSECGGLIGYLTGTGINTISKCWFNGSVQGLTKTGGIIGNVAMGTKTIQHCLVTGAVNTTDNTQTTKNNQTGGMIGAVANKEGLTVSISSCLTTGDVTDGYSSANCGGIIGYRGGTNTVNITDVYTTHQNGGIGTETNNDYKVGEEPFGLISSSDNIKGAVVYDSERGINLNYAVWIARENDIPVPRCFVGSIVSEEDTVEDTSGRMYVDTDWYTFNVNASTYSIDTVHELAGLAQLVNGGVTTFDGKTINLVKDIDLNDGWTAPATTADKVVVPGNTWMPIGNSASVSFQGTFNGNGNTIRGIYVDENVETTYTGLFGYTKTCVVKDLRLENSYFSTAKPYMGSIIGYGNGTLTNVYSDAIMHSTNIEVGGLVGRAVQENSSNRTLEMTGCWFDGDIRVVNSVDSSKTGDYATYVGGLLGYAYNSDATIGTCLYTGDISLVFTSATANPDARCAGLCGGDNSGTNAYVKIKDSIGVGTITGIMQGSATAINNLCTTIGRVRGSSTTCNNVYDMSVVTKVINGTSKTSSTKCGGNTGNEDAIRSNIHQTYAQKDIYGLSAQLLTNLDFVQDEKEAIWAARRGQIPAPAGLVADSDKLNIRFGKADTDIADGAIGDSAEDPYIIENVEELYGFAILSRENNFAGKFIKLSDDIDVLDLNPSESAEDWANGTVASLPWYSIGVGEDGLRFAGHFDGNGKTISGIYMNSDSSYLGLFAATETDSTISNLRLTNSYINYTGDDKAYTGSVVGDLRGDMTEVYSDAIVNSNGTQTGGLIGQVNEVSNAEAYAVDITNCWYDGQLTSSKNEAGGLIARAAKGTVNIDNCLYTGVIITTHNNANNIAAGICSRVEGGSVVTITDTISAGKITDANHGKNVKSVVGYIPNGSVAFEDVFATKTSYARAIPSTPSGGKYTGTIVCTQEADRLIGYCVEEVVEEGVVRKTKLEFGTNEWTIRTSDVPVLTCFADLEFVTPVSSEDLDEDIGLDYLNETLADAVDMGEGNYVLKATVDDAGFIAYKSTLESLGFGAPVVENVADRVHSVSYKKTNPDWVVTLTYVETTDTLTISINTNIKSLSDKLVSSDDEITYATGDVKMTMLQMYEYVDVLNENKEVIGTTPLDGIYADLSSYNFIPNYYKSYWYGNSFVFQVSEDHFVVCDGGEKEEYDDLINYMKAADGTADDPVYIDAWIISHQHGDHADVLKAVADDPTLANGIYVDAFYISEPNAKVLTDNALTDDVERQYYGMTLFVKNESGEQSGIYRMHTGQRYNFNGLVMDVIQTQDQIPYSAYGDYNATTPDKRDFNTASTVTLFSTATKKVLIGGDANYVNMEYIMKAYDADETDGDNYTPTSLLQNINVFVAFHHGKNMSMKLNKEDTSFVDYLTYEGHMFDHVLYPCSLIYGDAADPLGAFPYAGETNAYLNDKANNVRCFGTTGDYTTGNTKEGHVEITLQ